MRKRVPGSGAGLVLAVALLWPAGAGAQAQTFAAAPGAQPPARPTVDGGGCEATRPLREIVRACTALLERQPDNADYLALRGNAQRQMGNNAAAFKDLNAALAADPTHVFALSRRVSLEIGSGNEATTQADIDRLLAIAPVAAKDFEARGVVRSVRRDFAGAITEYSAGLELEPTNPSLLIDRATAYMALRNPTAAIADCQRLIAAHPNYAFAHYIHGRALTTQRQFDAAIAAVDSAIRLDPDRPLFYVERGRAHAGRGRTALSKQSYDLAMADYDRAIEANPALIDAHYNRGLLHLERHDYDKAIVDLTTVVALNRRFAPGFAARGQAYARQGNHDRAIADLSTAIELDPSQAEFWLRRSASLSSKGELDRAMADVDEAIKLGPTLAIAFVDRANLKNRKRDAAGAVEDAGKAIELQPSLVVAYTARAAAYVTLRDFDRALPDYNKAIELAPKFADTYLRRAEVLEALGRMQGASADRAHAASLNPQPAASPSPTTAALPPSTPPSTPPQPNSGPPSGAAPTGSPAPSPTALMLRAAERQIGRGEYDLAISELDKVLIMEPGSWTAYALRGLAYGGKKQFTQALLDASKAIDANRGVALGYTIRCSIELQAKAYQKALADCNKSVEIEPSNASGYALRGNAHLLLKSFGPAIKDFDKAIALGAKGTLATFHRGLAYFYSKNFTKAADDFRKVLEVEPEHRGALLGLRLLTEPSHNNAPMEVSIVRNADPQCGDQCAEWIAAVGRIDHSTPERFRAALKRIDGRRLPVFIDSMGGDLDASYAIGRLIRARNLDVYVTRTEPAKCPASSEVCRKAEAARITFGLPRGKLASCASACTNILAAGTVRSVGATALVGIHQAAYYLRQSGAVRVASDRSIPEHVYVRMKDFLVEMGVDAALMTRLLSTPHQSMYWLSTEELASSRLANQTKSGEELIAGGESDDFIVAAPKLADGVGPSRWGQPAKPR